MFTVQGRARQLYKAGYKTLQDVANADPKQMVHTIDHMSNKVANQITAAAKVSNLCGPLQHSFMYLDVFSHIRVMDVQPTTVKGKRGVLGRTNCPI